MLASDGKVQDATKLPHEDTCQSYNIK